MVPILNSAKILNLSTLTGLLPSRRY